MYEIKELTGRQKEVLIAYSKFGLGKTAARSLGISYRTYNNHCTAIYQKLGVNNITQAMILAIRAGIVE